MFVVYSLAMGMIRHDCSESIRKHFGDHFSSVPFLNLLYVRCMYSSLNDNFEFVGHSAPLI